MSLLEKKAIQEEIILLSVLCSNSFRSVSFMKTVPTANPQN